MNKEKRYLHLFYGFVPILVYFGVSMVVVFLGEQLNWKNHIINFFIGLLNLFVLYTTCYRIYNMRGGTREIPPLLPCLEMYQKEGVWKRVSGNNIDTQQKQYWKLSPAAYIWIVVLGASSCIALNNWFSIMELFEKISSYKEVSESIYYGGLWMIFARTAILAPLVEEILVRGMVYRGISCVLGRIVGMVASALIFALMHGNLLQGIYAFILGILFAYVYDMSGRNIWAPILAHMSANAISVFGTIIPSVAEFFAEYFFILTGLATILMVLAVIELYNVKKIRIDS